MRQRKTDRHLPPCVYFKHGAYWFVRKGKWHRLGTGLQDALHEYARIQAQPGDGMAKLIEDALPHILKGRNGKGLAPITVKQYTIAARRLQSILAEFTPEQVKPVHVAQLRRKLSDKPAVANRAATVLRLVFEWAVEEQRAESNPCVGIRAVDLPARDRLIAPGEYQAIYAKAPARLQVMMDLCYLTGQRIGDVLAIKRADLRDEGIYFRQQKTGKQLIVEWTPELRAAVDRAKALLGNLAPLTLFYGKAGQPPRYQIVWRQWRAACKAAGVENANIHDLRALAGTDADRQGVDATELLGHTDRQTTRRYLRDKRAKVVSGPSSIRQSKDVGQKS